jgi:hypothetical protein
MKYSRLFPFYISNRHISKDTYFRAPDLRQYDCRKLLAKIQGVYWRMSWGCTGESQVEVRQYWRKSSIHTPILAIVDSSNRYTIGRHWITQLWVKSFCVFGKVNVQQVYWRKSYWRLPATSYFHVRLSKRISSIREFLFEQMSLRNW